MGGEEEGGRTDGGGRERDTIQDLSSEDQRGGVMLAPGDERMGENACEGKGEKG